MEETVSSLDKHAAKRRSGQPGKKHGKSRVLLRRAVIKWLLENDPAAALATGVSTRISNFRVDIAAFWNHRVKNQHDREPSYILKPYRTLIVECYTDREDCWPDCTRTENLAGELRELKQKRSLLEQDIRQREPELRDNNVLFSEYEEWRYEDSSNIDYHRLQAGIIKLEKSLLAGTRFEKIRGGKLADQLLLAVPAGLIKPAEMADGWGLLWINNDLSAELQKAPDYRECMAENRLHLAQNIATAATRSVLFATGVNPPPKDGKERGAVLVQPPRAHRKPKQFQFSE